MLGSNCGDTSNSVVSTTESGSIASSTRSSSVSGQRVFNDLSSWLRSRVVSVSQVEAKHLQVVCENHGIKLFVSNSNTRFNPHSFSAVCREQATMRVLANELEGKTRGTVLDVFGSARSRRIDPRVSPPFGRVMINGRPKKTIDMSIDWIAAPDTPIAGDASRGSFVRQPYPDELADVVVCIDIYQSGLSSDTPFTPEFALECIWRSKTKTAYWIGRMFPGVAGGDELLPSPFRQDYAVEQIYFRREDGLVVSYPDGDVSQPYAPHPTPDWLYQRSHRGVDISHIEKVGPYHVFRLSQTMSKAVMIREIRPPQGEVEVMWVPYTKYFAGVVPVSTTRRLFVHMPTFRELQPRFVARVPNGMAMDSVKQQVSDAFNRIPWLKVFGRSDRFLFEYMRIADDTAYAALYCGRGRESSAWSNMRRAHVDVETNLVQARAASNSYVRNVVSFPVAIVAVVSLTVAGIVSMFKFHAAWIFPKYPVLSAFAEELLAIVSEELAVCGYFYEFCKAPKNVHSIARLMFHFVLSILRIWFGELGRTAALLIHIVHNLVGREKYSPQFYKFSRAYAEGRHVEVYRGVVEAIPDATILPPYTSTALSGPAKLRGNLSIKVDGYLMTPERACDVLSYDFVCSNITFPVLITNRLLFQPANNAKNLLVAVLWRTHNDPFVQCKWTFSERCERWSAIALLFEKNFPLRLDSEPLTVEENSRLMGKRGRRLVEAYFRGMAGELTFTGKTINLKWNETIGVGKALGDQVTMKPRAIQNLPPIVHATMGGTARMISNHLHELFDGTCFNLAGCMVRIFFAAGYNQEQLSSIAWAGEMGFTVFAMSGDDSMVVWNGVRPELGGEADQSQFDHTQDDGPLAFFICTWLSKCGVPSWFTDLALACCRSGYTVRKGRLKISGWAGTQMPTGITTTTIFNSLSTLAMFVYFIFNRHKLVDLAEAGAHLGFQVKYEPRHRIESITFLKGWFQRTDRSLQWFPLPSACLKIGKLLRDPVDITVRRVKGKKVRLRREDAIRVCAFALAESYGAVPPSYPILGQFLSTMKRLGVRPRTTIEGLEESWKPRVGLCDVYRESVLVSLLDRYNISEDEVVDIERLLRSVESLPAYVEHSVFDKLAERDY